MLMLSICLFARLTLWVCVTENPALESVNKCRSFSRVSCFIFQQSKKWNGLVKSVLDGDVDMIVTSMQITPDRSLEIDFSVPFLETGITILVAVRAGVISPTAFLGLGKVL